MSAGFWAKAHAWRNSRVSWVMVIAFCSASPVMAQNGNSFLGAAESRVPYTDTPFAPQMQCSDFISRTTSDFSVLSAELHVGVEDSPDHCHIIAVIPPEIVFEVTMPVAWNGRFYMHGNGGFAGQSLESMAGYRQQALRHGFATAYTNTGHDAKREPGASFAYNNLQKTIDYTFRAVHLTAVFAKQLISDFYSREQSYSYWDGCSMGGRQGLVSAQRFPQDFDGIVAGAPAFDFTGIMISYTWQSRVMEGSHFSSDKLELLSDTVYARCDTLDGLKDGLITDPRRCDFDPARDLPACTGAGEGDTCFSTDEITRLTQVYQGPQRDGASFYPGVPKGAEVRGQMRAGPGANTQWASGWVPWLVNPNGTILQQVMAESYYKYLMFEVDNPEYNWKDYPLEAPPEGRDLTNAALLDAKSTNLAPFRKRGGKMISYFGWADTAINPLPMVGYYESLQNAMNSPPQDFFRLFMVPGMFHCAGGAGADQIDVMTPVIEWVEAGIEPATITGNNVVDGAVKFSRPHCPYPQETHYKGSGPADSAKSFECTLNR